MLGSSDAGALRIEVVNFVQRHRRRRPSERGLLTMDHRPARTIEQAEARYHVAIGEWSLVEIAWQSKLVVRCGERTSLLPGNHEVRDPLGTIEDSAEIVCLHAPLGTTSRIEAWVKHGRRVVESGAPDGRMAEPPSSTSARRASATRSANRTDESLDVRRESAALSGPAPARGRRAHVPGPLSAPLAACAPLARRSPRCAGVLHAPESRRDIVFRWHVEAPSDLDSRESFTLRSGGGLEARKS